MIITGPRKRESLRYQPLGEARTTCWGFSSEEEAWPCKKNKRRWWMWRRAKSHELISSFPSHLFLFSLSTRRACPDMSPFLSRRCRIVHIDSTIGWCVMKRAGFMHQSPPSYLLWTCICTSHGANAAVTSVQSCSLPATPTITLAPLAPLAPFLRSCN